MPLERSSLLATRPSFLLAKLRDAIAELRSPSSFSAVCPSLAQYSPLLDSPCPGDSHPAFISKRSRRVRRNREPAGTLHRHRPPHLGCLPLRSEPSTEESLPEFGELRSVLRLLSPSVVVPSSIPSSAVDGHGAAVHLCSGDQRT